MAEIGVPAVNFYGMLSGLGDTIQNNRKLAQDQQLKEALKNGLPKAGDGSIDWDTTSKLLGEHGADLPTMLTVAKLGQDQRKQQDELKAHADLFGGLGRILSPGSSSPTAGAPSAAPSTVQPAPLPSYARSPVTSTPKVWGDKEAEDAGLYDPPPKPAMANYGASLGGPKPDPYASMRDPAPQPQPAVAATAAQPAAPPSAHSPDKSGFQGIGVQHIPALVAAMGSPRLSSGDRETVGIFLKKALDDAKEPDKIRTLTALKEQSGYPGTILQLEMDLKKAGKTDVTTNIDQKGETEEAKSAGKAAGERRAKMFDAANGATNNLANLTRVQTLLDQVDQGKLAPGRMTISAWAKSLGVNDDFAKGLGLDPAKVGDSQALQAMTNELVLGKIGAGGLPANNFSDADRQFLTDTLPKLGNDPRGNKILIEAAKRVNQGNIQRALDYQSWKEDPTNKGRSFEDFELTRAKKISQMDRFGDLRKQAETLVAPDSSQSADGWQSVAPGVRIRERR